MKRHKAAGLMLGASLMSGGGLVAHEGIEQRIEQSRAVFDDPAFTESIQDAWMGKTNSEYQPSAEVLQLEARSRNLLVGSAALFLSGITVTRLSVRRSKKVVDETIIESVTTHS